MKKILALVLALMLVLGMTAALADTIPTSQTIDANSAPDATTGKYTISVASTDTHTYTVYQILTGTLIAGQSKLGNPAWGSDAVGTSDIDTFITNVSADGLTNAQINALVEAELKNGATGVGTVDSSNPLDVAPGYYIIKDTTANLADGDARSLNIVAVFNDIQITPKKGTTTSNKHVDDVNDSDPTIHSELKDSADYDIGDSIPYTLTFTLPADYANYKKYYVSFVDDMSAGLTYNGDATIWYGDVSGNGTDIGSAFAQDTNATSAYTSGKVYKYSIADLKTGTDEQKGLTAGQTITIKYTATLNASAVIGSAGNPNKYKVDFSSNPNEEGAGTPETNDTPWDINIAFTYKTVFTKEDGATHKPLTGADFRLDKFIAAANGSVTYKGVKGDWIDVTTLHSGNDHPTKTVEDYTKDSDTAVNAKFTFAGLDDGYYRLVETATPEGYNTIDPIEFTITAEHQLSSDNPKLTSLTGTDDATFTMTPVKDSNNEPTGELDATIDNNQGATLPSTGGIGTTIFYVGGGLLVLAAIILLVTKRRMSSND